MHCYDNPHIHWLRFITQIASCLDSSPKQARNDNVHFCLLHEFLAVNGMIYHMARNFGGELNLAANRQIKIHQY